MRDTIKVGNVELNGGRFCLVVAGEDIPVTVFEFRILSYLMKHKGEVLTYDQITDAYRKEEAVTNKTNIYVHVSKINQKIGFRFIESVRSVGYVVREEANT